MTGQGRRMMIWGAAAAILLGALVGPAISKLFGRVLEALQR